MNKNSLRNYLSMLWKGRQLTSLQVLKAMKKDGFSSLSRRDKKFLLSLLKDIEKGRLSINDELLEEIIKLGNESQLNPC